MMELNSNRHTHMYVCTLDIYMYTELSCVHICNLIRVIIIYCM